MAFSPNDRVRVSSQASEFRGKLGTVLSAADGANVVRIDGYAATKGVRLLDPELVTSTLVCQIEYPE